jgi:hypothetical protein
MVYNLLSDAQVIIFLMSGLFSLTLGIIIGILFGSQIAIIVVGLTTIDTYIHNIFINVNFYKI